MLLVSLEECVGRRSAVSVVVAMAAQLAQDDCVFSAFMASPDGVYQNSTSIP